ncbi:MAG: hypothetical protein ACREM1_05395 [Longimicrobiales bacterium]
MESESRPEFEVWNHLESGLDLATDELTALASKDRELVSRVGNLLAKLRDDFVISRQDADLAEALEELLSHPWIRHAAEIQIAHGLIGRASHALDRYRDLRPVASALVPDERVRRYLKEAAATFLLGFDAATIAFCGAALEQVLKQVLVARGVIQPSSSDNEWAPPGKKLVDAAVRVRLLVTSEEAARRLLKQRNRVMHRSMSEQSALRGVALTCIQDLAETLRELPATEEPDET